LQRTSTINTKNEVQDIGSERWWLWHANGATFFDNAILQLIRFGYLAFRVGLKVLLGKKRRDEYLRRKGIDFKQFLYGALKAIGLENKLVLEVDVPDYAYRICCPINKEDLVVVTKHERDIISQFFNPKEGDVVVDVGAHFGRYALIAASKVKHGQVFAIEAHPGNFRLLERSVKLNKLHNVTAYQCAAYSKKTRLKLYLPDEDLGYTMHHSIMADYLVSKYKQYNARKIEDQFIEVEADALDNLLPVPEINWLKIDVEGAELDVLKGCSKILTSSNDISILIEVHGKETYKPLLDLLQKGGFRIEFEKTYDNGEKHLLATKKKDA
jgi:FkbM family methyltransferase